MRFSTLLFLFIYSGSSGQPNSYQNLLDTALKARGSLFVHSKPLRVTRLDPKDMRYYFETLRDYSNQKLDTVMFSQIILNMKTADTSLWAEYELPNFLLVKERGETVSMKYARQKFHLTDNKKIKHFNRYVKKFNSTEVNHRIICYYSRPIFDNSKTFAILQWDNGHGYLGGGGGINLYKLQSDGSWSEFGPVAAWRY